ANAGCSTTISSTERARSPRRRIRYVASPESPPMPAHSMVIARLMFAAMTMIPVMVMIALEPARARRVAVDPPFLVEHIEKVGAPALDDGEADTRRVARSYA